MSCFSMVITLRGDTMTQLPQKSMGKEDGKKVDEPVKVPEMVGSAIETQIW